MVLIFLIIVGVIVGVILFFLYRRYKYVILCHWILCKQSSIYLSIYLSIHLSIYVISISLSIYLSRTEFYSLINKKKRANEPDSINGGGIVLVNPPVNGKYILSLLILLLLLLLYYYRYWRCKMDWSLWALSIHLSFLINLWFHLYHYIPFI